jgi:hypothetical protein
MDPTQYLWAEALARQQALRSEVARERLAALVSRPPQLAFRAVLARGLRNLANRLDGQGRATIISGPQRSRLTVCPTERQGAA